MQRGNDKKLKWRINLLIKDNHDLTVITSPSLASSWICQPVRVTVLDLIVPH
jgi:hypothetical protein